MENNLISPPLLDEFLENFTSAHTRTSYHNDISQFSHFLLSHFPKLKIEDIKRLHIIKFRNFLSSESDESSPMAPKTVARKLAGLSSFFDFLVERAHLAANPVTSVKRPRREVLNPTHALSAEQVDELLSAINLQTPSGKLHHALLTMLFTTGLRKSEILKLKFRDLKPMNEHYIVEFRGKGGKVGQKLLHPLCLESLQVYMSWMQSSGRNCEDNAPLFQPTKNPANPQKLSKSINPKTLNEIIAKYAKKIGLNFKVSSHSARATFITQLLHQGEDIYTVAREVHHSSVKTTSEYDKRKKSIEESPVYRLNYQSKKSA